MLSGNEILKGEGGGDKSQLTDVSSGALVQVVLLKGYVAKLTKGISSENVYWDLKCWGQKLYKTKEKRFVAFRLHHWRKNLKYCIENNWRIGSLLPAPGCLPQLENLRPSAEINDKLGVPSHSLLPQGASHTR